MALIDCVFQFLGKRTWKLTPTEKWCGNFSNNQSIQTHFP